VTLKSFSKTRVFKRGEYISFMSTKKSAKFNFESAMTEINQIVEKLERGGVSLEESLQDFERGIALTRQCQKALAEAEQKVQILMEKNGASVLSPYTAGDEDEEQ